MGAGIGNLGGIALVAEATWGTTPAVPAWVWQHPVESTFGFRRELIEPSLLSYSGRTARGYAGGYADGDISVGLELKDSIIGIMLGLAGVLQTDKYVFGTGTPQDINSASALINYDGGGASPENAYEFIYAGVKPNALRFDLVADSNSVLTLVGTGKDVTETAAGSAETPNPPAESGVFMPTDLGTVLIDTETVCLFDGSIEVLVPKTGFDRRCMGGNMREQIVNARPDITFSLNLSLDDSATNNTIEAIRKFIAGTSLGDIQLGTDFLLQNCFMTGDFPPLSDGEIDFTLNGTAQLLDVSVT